MQGGGQESGTAEQLLAVVRVHADRVHDAVRRLGCPPAAALDVVEDSALDLLEQTSHGVVDAPVGRWFALARERAAHETGAHALAGASEPPGEGLLAADDHQARLGAALAALPERERFALLLHDSYDLPVPSVAAALGTTDAQAREEVRRARLAVLPRLDLRPDTADAQERAARLLSGLVVVALPPAERGALLGRVERAARTALPAAVTSLGSRVLEVEHPVRRGRVLSPLGVVVGLVLAAAVGAGAGLLLGRSPGAITAAEAAGDQPLVSAPPLPTASPAPAAQRRRAASPPPATTRLFTLAPSPSPTPTASPSPSPTPSPTLSAATVASRPAGGPNGTEVTVTGRGWTPGKPVTVLYLDATGTSTGSSAAATPGADGGFTTTLAAQDPQNLPGPHEVRATNGSQQASGSYDAAA